MITQAVAAVNPDNPATPAGLRALADLITADPGPTPDADPHTTTDSTVLRAVAAVLDPATTMLDTYRAIASTRHTDHRHNWQPTLHTLTNRLPDTTAADMRALTDGINARTDRRHVNELLDNLTAEQTENLHTAITASTANSAADLARAWQNVTTPDGLIPALPKPAGSWAGTVTTTTTPPPPAPRPHTSSTTPHHPPPTPSTSG
ncbi:hypothetical protein JD77_04544 [Micromonospora olivasterospora]|uniref:Uncharacterized protein n=1 Tax=Micromonospora olivasterospora TaxID=1880 RepID=A0A562IG03_MICOL|nr:hypothetical protein JD77_04544 [Micromonospora olivasterospora]